MVAGGAPGAYPSALYSSHVQGISPNGRYTDLLTDRAARVDGVDRPEAIVRIRDLGKVYEPTPRWMRFLVRTIITEPVVALQDIDLDVAAGHICAVVGPNGAGKTTLFRVLIGLTTMSSGSATVAGYDVRHESLQVRRLIGWMPSEDRSLFMRVSPRENLLFHGRLHGIDRHDLTTRVNDALEQVGLAHQRNSAVFALSAGMRARLQLARALLTRPRVLILDEPTGSVDPVGAHELLALIVSLVREQRMAALISSHRLEEIEALGSHLVLLDRGKICFQGDLSTLRAHYDRPRLELEFRTSAAAAAAARILTAVGDVSSPTSTSVACGADSDLTAGPVMTALGSLVADVIRIREVRLPLRNILAEIYRSAPFAKTGTW